METELPPRPSPWPVTPDLERWRQAAADLRYLLDRGYPREASLNLVGNRYHLTQPVRQLLHRGVLAAAVAQARREKRFLLASQRGQPLAIDGHNVLITLECALRGWPLVAADDGWLRDIGQLSRRYRPSATTTQALELMGSHLHAAGLKEALVFYDAPMSGSGELAAATRSRLAAFRVPGGAKAVPVPEVELLATGFPVATSDGALIDAAAAAVDLAGEIIAFLPKAWIINLAGAGGAVEPPPGTSAESSR